ncbi:MAG: TolC family protein [Candidatus Eremiobacteraeota bacterium]|nr:TolC family protein [Candidatus Eremiobacteraeota bacterium]
MKRLLLMALLALPGWADPQPITYGEAVQMGLERNLALQNAGLEVPAAQARLDQAYAARNPNLNLNSTYLRQADALVRAQLPGTTQLLNGNGANISAAQLTTRGPEQMLNRLALVVPVYTGGRLEAAIHERRSLLEAENYGLKRNRQLTALTIKSSYLQALLARENLEVSELNLKEAERNNSLTLSRKKAGVGTKFDTMQAQVAVANGQEAVARTQIDWQRRQAELAATLNLPLATSFDLRESLTAPQTQLESLATTDLDELTKVALSQRPELDQLRARLTANNEGRIGASSSLLPQINLSLNYDMLGNPSNLQGGWSLLATLSFPLWDGGLSEARQQEFTVREDQLRVQEKETIQRIALEVREAYLSLQEADQRLKAALSGVDAATEAVRVGRLRYDVGAATSLEIITAQANLSDAQYLAAASRYGQMQARASLNAAQGVDP